MKIRLILSPKETGFISNNEYKTIMAETNASLEIFDKYQVIGLEVIEETNASLELFNNYQMEGSRVIEETTNEQVEENDSQITEKKSTKKASKKSTKENIEIASVEEIDAAKEKLQEIISKSEKLVVQDVAPAVLKITGGRTKKVAECTFEELEELVDTLSE